MRIAIMLNEKASIVCFEQFIEAFLTESSKSPALIAKSNKQRVGTYLHQEEEKLLLINCEAVIWL